MLTVHFVYFVDFINKNMENIETFYENYFLNNIKAVFIQLVPKDGLKKKCYQLLYLLQINKS